MDSNQEPSNFMTMRPKGNYTSLYFNLPNAMSVVLPECEVLFSEADIFYLSEFSLVLSKPYSAKTCLSFILVSDFIPFWFNLKCQTVFIPVLLHCMWVRNRKVGRRVGLLKHWLQVEVLLKNWLRLSLDHFVCLITIRFWFCNHLSCSNCHKDIFSKDDEWVRVTLMYKVFYVLHVWSWKCNPAVLCMSPFFCYKFRSKILTGQDCTEITKVKTNFSGLSSIDSYVCI